MNGPPARGERERRDAKRNRERLLAAARDLFEREGVAARTDDIARLAGVGVGTLYRHFPTREAIVEALFEERLDEFAALAETALAHARAWDGLVELLERMLEFQVGDRVLKQVFMRYPPGRGSSAAARERLQQQFEQLLERARAEGTLREDFTLADLTLLVWSFAPLIDATAEVAPHAAKRHLHWLLDGIKATNTSIPAERPLTDEQLSAAMEALREGWSLRRGRHSENP